MGVVGRGVRGGRPPGRARAALGRLRGLPLVPRHGPRVVRGRRDGRAGQRRVRRRQGRPRGAARHRRGLHGGHPGDDRAGWLADDLLPHPGGGALPLRHLLPDGALPAPARRRHAGVDRRRCAGAQLRGADRRPAGRQRRCGPAARGARRGGAGGRRAGTGRRVRRRERRVRGRAEVPAVDDAGVPAAPPRAHRVGSGAAPRGGDGGADGPRRHVRPARGRFRPLQRGRALGRSTLREDALRQRAAAAGLRPPRPHRGPACGPRPAGGGGDRGVPAAGPAHARGRVRLGAGRRHGRRRGSDLRLDARRADGGPRREGRRLGRAAARGHAGGDVRARLVDPAAARGPRRSGALAADPLHAARRAEPAPAARP